MARRRRSIPWLALAIAVLACVAFAAVRDHEFVNIDDPQYVFENPRVTDGLTMGGIAWAFTAGHAGNWHPLTWISHMIDVELFGLDAGAHHLVSVAFHAINILLLFGVLRRMTGNAGASACVAALFGLHPLRVESVAWIAERKDVLSTFFWLLAMHAYVRYTAKPSARAYATLLAAFVAGLMSKPSVVTLPIALLLLDYWPLARKNAWMCVREKLPMLALSLAAGLVTIAVQGRAGAIAALDVLPVAERLANAGVAYVLYLWKTIWPVGLAPLYPYDAAPPAAMAALCWAAVIGASLAAWIARRRAPWFAIGWAWYVITLLPMIGLIQVGAQPLADRYTYVPMIGIYIALAWTLMRFVASRNLNARAVAGTAAVIVLGLAALTWQQVSHWRDSVTLWRHAVDTHGNYRARANLGQALTLKREWYEAMPVLEEAIRQKPGFADSHHHLGLALDAIGRREAAVDRYREAVRLRPHYPEAQGNLGIALAERGDIREGLPHLREAMRLSPESPLGRMNLLAALANLGALEDNNGNRGAALAAYREALSLATRPADKTELERRIRALEAAR